MKVEKYSREKERERDKKKRRKKSRISVFRGYF